MATSIKFDRMAASFIRRHSSTNSLQTLRIGLHPVQIAVDVDLEQGHRAVPGTACGGRVSALEAQLAQVQLVDEDIDDADRTVLVDPVIESLGEENALRSIRPFDVSPH